MSATQTFAPREAKWIAKDRPMPEPPPVRNAVVLVKVFIATWLMDLFHESSSSRSVSNSGLCWEKVDK
jgi:hypothetical protein